MERRIHPPVAPAAGLTAEGRDSCRPTFQPRFTEHRAAGVPPFRHFGHAPFTRSRAMSLLGSTTTCFTRWRFHV